MLDYRLKTFLNLCNTMSYTKTAEEIHMTQPAVTQHIQFLEDYYNKKLFLYENRKLELTDAGNKLYEFSIGLKSSTDKMEDILARSNTKVVELNFGATLTIGQYIMPKILMEIEKENPDIEISMTVSNTENLLKAVEEGCIDFALVEGHFNKNDYEHYLFSEEEFISVGANGINTKDYFILEELYKENLIVRERGSGTREILEQLLYERNLNICNFKKVNQIGDMNAIKEMVESGMGVTFLYEKAVREELENRSLEKLNIKDFNIKREFNFIFLKNSFYGQEYKDWYESFLEVFKRIY